MKLARMTAAGVAVVALALTGCTGNPGTAAQVGDVTVSTAQVEAAAQELVAGGLADPRGASRIALQGLAQGVASQQVADENGVAVTEADRQRVLARAPEIQALTATEGGRPFADALATYFVARTTMGAEAFDEALREADVEVNPRYGRWDSFAPTGNPQIPSYPGLVDDGLSRSYAELAQRR